MRRASAIGAGKRSRGRRERTAGGRAAPRVDLVQEGRERQRAIADHGEGLARRREENRGRHHELCRQAGGGRGGVSAMLRRTEEEGGQHAPAMHMNAQIAVAPFLPNAMR